MIKHFRSPDGFASFTYMTQVVQAIAVKIGVEHWRRSKPYCMGTLYWQLNDNWPGPSWSSLEYNGEWKILHNFAKKFYNPLLFSIVEPPIPAPQETGLRALIPKPETPNPNAIVEVWATSDRSEEISGDLIIDLWKFLDDRPVTSWKISTTMPAFSSAVVWSQKCTSIFQQFQGTSRENSFLVCRWGESNQNNDILTNFHFFSPPKKAVLAPPDLTIESIKEEKGQFVITLKSQKVGLFVYLTNEKYYGRFSDNGFLLLPNLEKEVVFYLWDGPEYPHREEKSIPTKNIQNFRENLVVCSYVDTYQAASL